MSIKRFFNQDIVVRRLRAVDSTKSGYQATATADGTIQELDPRARAIAGIVQSKAWYAWFDENEDIQEGDQLTDENGVIYIVQEVLTADFGINRHKQCVLIEYNV